MRQDTAGHDPRCFQGFFDETRDTEQISQRQHVDSQRGRQAHVRLHAWLRSSGAGTGSHGGRGRVVRVGSHPQQVQYCTVGVQARLDRPFHSVRK